MKKAFIYARFSPRPGAAECQSCDTQESLCRKWCEAHGYASIETFRDEDVSGASTDNRPGLDWALRYACESQGTVVVYSLSRLARNVRDALMILDRLQAAGASLAILDMNLDSSTPIGRVVFTVMAAFAELERNEISKRTSDALQHMQSEGKRVSRHAPYGWMIEGKELKQVQEEQSILGMIFTWKDLDWTHEQIADGLNQNKRPYRGRRWKTADVDRVIRRRQKG